MNIYDLYAAAALNALIAKLPLLDRDGEFNKAIGQEELNLIKTQIAKSAHDYAVRMIEERKHFVNDNTP